MDGPAIDSLKIVVAGDSSPVAMCTIPNSLNCADHLYCLAYAISSNNYVVNAFCPNLPVIVVKSPDRTPPEPPRNLATLVSCCGTCFPSAAFAAADFSPRDGISLNCCVYSTCRASQRSFTVFA